MNVGRFGLVWLVVLLLAISLFSACGGDSGTGTPDGDSPDGDEPDGDTGDGDEPDGDTGDGDSSDGDATDGDGEDGDLEDGDLEDGDDSDGDEGFSIDERHVDWVDPFIGTGGLGFGFGSGVPGPKTPFGMIHPSPDTMGEHGVIPFYHFGGYYYDDPYIIGFSHTHLYGVGANDMGNILLMPTLNEPSFDATRRKQYRSDFRKETEDARPGYYTVLLDRPNVLVELTATARVAHHRYHYPPMEDNARGYVVLDLGHVIPDAQIVEAQFAVGEDNQSVEGWVFDVGAFTGRYGGLKIYFAMRFSRPFASVNGFAGNTFSEDRSLHGVDGEKIGAYLGFDLSGSDGLLEVQVAISYVSTDNAWLNLTTETPDWDFDAVHEAAEAAWEAEMRVVRFAGGSAEERVIMSTALYHACIMPNLFMDVNNEFIGFDKQTHVADFAYHNEFSLWDTYRTEHPFLHLTKPEFSVDLMKSLVKMAELGGDLPKWPQGAGDTGFMVGTPADIAIADAYLKGVTDFDVEFAYERMSAVAVAPSTQSNYGTRSGVLDYVNLGYVSTDHSSSVSKTMEYAIADYAMHLLALALGKPQEEADAHLARSKNYANHWDPDRRFFIGRDAEGNFVESFNPLRWENFYAEGTAWQYLWLVPHDPAGLIDVFGTPDSMLETLTDFFELGKEQLENRTGLELLDAPTYYWHGNEPDIHAAYLFNEVGRPDLTQKWVDWASAFHYSSQPDGIAGNDDCGTLSSWYIFSSMGFYPVAGTPKYWIGRPLFPYAEMTVTNGTLVVEAPGAGGENIYVQSVTLNGQPLTVPWFDHADIADGGTLHFEMGPEPSQWGRSSGK